MKDKTPKGFEKPCQKSDLSLGVSRVVTGELEQVADWVAAFRKRSRIEKVPSNTTLELDGTFKKHTSSTVSGLSPASAQALADLCEVEVQCASFLKRQWRV